MGAIFQLLNEIVNLSNDDSWLSPTHSKRHLYVHLSHNCLSLPPILPLSLFFIHNNNISITMLRVLLIIAVLTVLSVRAAYEPELMLTATSSLLNKQLTKNGHNISDAINQYHVADIHGEQKAATITFKYNLTAIKQKVDINWKGNILTPINTHAFTTNSKNLNLTLDGQLEVKIGITRKQKGPLKVIVTGLEVDTAVRFASSKCAKGLGFDIQIDDVYVNAKALSIKIEGKGFDNLVISELEKILAPRVPGILKNAITDKVNPLISHYACTRIEEDLQVGNQSYIAVINTTMVPEFDDGLHYIRIPIDLTLQNLRTNETNDQLERDDLPQNQQFQGSADASVALSSNFLNTVMWLVEDSKLLHLVVTGDMLGDNPPIALNTTNLSILMPKLKENWPNKAVFLVIAPSSKFEHLLVRSGRLITVLSLSVKFAVILKDQAVLKPDQCIASGECIVACDLNMTLPLSVSLKTGSKLAFGLLHSAAFYDISIINSLIEINLGSLKDIINEIVGSMLPDVNQQLSNGMDIPKQIWEKLAAFDVVDLLSKMFQDYLALGIKVDL